MKPIYLDAAANTPIDKEVVNAMKPYLKPGFVGNSHSLHEFGVAASQAIEDSRKRIASSIGVGVKDIVFTSGATEGNNMVIKGLAYKELTSGKPKKHQRRHIVCGATEHDSVIKSCEQLKKLGFIITYVQPNESGYITIDQIEPVCNEDTLLVCIMSVNNELGVGNHVSDITRFTDEHGILSLVDCTQGLGYGGSYIHIHHFFPHATFLTFSAHKIYGPMGIGCLIAPRGGLEYLRDASLITGGGQEFGLRGSTSNVAAIVGMAKAVELIEVSDHEQHYYSLYQYLLTSLDNEFPGQYKLNVTPEFYNIISLNMYPCLNFDSLANQLGLLDVAVSAGSACDANHDETNGEFNPSHVLLSLGLSEPEIRNTVRISFCKDTTSQDIKEFVERLKELKEVMYNGDGQ